MSSDEPFDFEAPDQPRSPRPKQAPLPKQAPPRRVPSSAAAPGRRPARPTSRARTDGAAKPLPPDRAQAGRGQGNRTQPDRTQGPRATGRTNGNRTTRATPRQGERPPSYAPGTTPRSEQAGQRTRTMPTTPRSVSASSRSDRPGTRPPDAPPAKARQGTSPKPQPRKPVRKRRRGRIVFAVLAVVLVLVLAWPIGLLIWANGKISHVDALNGGVLTPGTTYLLAGSDSRADGTLQGDPTEGERTDTIMLLTVPRSGTTSLISLPRDTYVDIPGHGPNKLNAAFAFGGAPLLVETVEGLTGIGIDHYVEIGMGGVSGLVDAVGGVELCLDYVVDDKDSGLVWEEPGCQVVDGATALAFARMRKSDPLGDIGRTQRQQQVIQAVTGAVAEPSLVWQPGEQVRLIDAGLGALTVSEGTNILDMGRLALAFRQATGENGVRGTPPIASLDYRPGNVGSTVLLDEVMAPAFFDSLVDGTVTQEDAEHVG